MTFQQALAANVLVFDGAMGTEIYRHHVFTNRSFDELCLADPKLIQEIHRQYCDAGADVLTTNTFGANRVALAKLRPGREDRRDQSCRRPAGARGGRRRPAGRCSWPARSGRCRPQPQHEDAVAGMIVQQADRPDGRRRRFHHVRDAADPAGAGAVRGRPCGSCPTCPSCCRWPIVGPCESASGEPIERMLAPLPPRTAHAGRLGNELRQPARTGCSAPWRRRCG